MTNPIPAEVIASEFMRLAKEIAASNPGKSVDVSLCGCIYHTPQTSPDILRWSVTVGHGQAQFGSTLDECLAKLAAIGSPETKLAKAAELRRQAEALEAEANKP